MKPRVTVRTPQGIEPVFIMHGEVGLNKGWRLKVFVNDFPSFNDAWAAALAWAKGGPSPYPRP